MSEKCEIFTDITLIYYGKQYNLSVELGLQVVFSLTKQTNEVLYKKVVEFWLSMRQLMLILELLCVVDYVTNNPRANIIGFPPNMGRTPPI